MPKRLPSTSIVTIAQGPNTAQKVPSHIEAVKKLSQLTGRELIQSKRKKKSKNIGNMTNTAYGNSSS